VLTDAEAGVRPRQTNTRRAWRRFRANRLAVVALAASVLLAVTALGAPLVSRYVTGVEPNKQSLLHNFEGRSDDHWLGTDEYGRDVLTRLVYGARVSLGVAGLAAAVTVLVGTLVGAVAAYRGGWVDQALMRFVDVMLAIPGIYLLLLLGALFTVGPAELAVLIALIGWYGLARLVRAEMLSLRRREFVEAARVLGAPGWAIVLRHLLPNVVHLVIVFATTAIPGYLLLEAALSFLGLGVRPPTPSLGSMLIGSTQYLYKRPALIFFPGLTIAAIALAVSIVGNALRDALDPRLDA
jgi:ABC-type dipeptide/oligopeptide/nickel transport system permease subunit